MTLWAIGWTVAMTSNHDVPVYRRESHEMGRNRDVSVTIRPIAYRNLCAHIAHMRFPGACSLQFEK